MNIYRKVTILPATTPRKAASITEAASLETNNACTFVPGTPVLTRKKHCLSICLHEQGEETPQNTRYCARMKPIVLECLRQQFDAVCRFQTVRMVPVPEAKVQEL